MLAQDKLDVLTTKKDYEIYIHSGYDDADHQATLALIRNNEGESELLMAISPIPTRFSDNFGQFSMHTVLTPSELDVACKLSSNMTSNDIADMRFHGVASGSYDKGIK